MTPWDRKEVESLVDRARSVALPGIDNLSEIVKERDLAVAYVTKRAIIGDDDARAILDHLSKPLPHKF